VAGCGDDDVVEHSDVDEGEPPEAGPQLAPSHTIEWRSSPSLGSPPSPDSLCGWDAPSQPHRACAARGHAPHAGDSRVLRAQAPIRRVAVALQR
jgi:hypothetical protein